MKVAILGQGAIGRYVQAACEVRGIAVGCVLVRPGKERADSRALRVSSVTDLPADITLLVDCAGHAGLAEHGPVALRRGIDVLTVSIGALADPALVETLEAAAETGGAVLELATGAIGALDVLRGAAIGGLDHVQYRGRKPPAGWRGSPAEKVIDFDQPMDAPVVHFAGTARAAALAYPKNANVAAAVALAGLGMDATQVELIADPGASGNTHDVTASGTFGTMTFSITGQGLPDNPKSSALAAMSLVAAIANRNQRLRF